MPFTVIKSHLDGISKSHHATLDEALKGIYCFRGWDSLDRLRTAIRQWAEDAEPGDVFDTSVSALIATGIANSVSTDDECPDCGGTDIAYEMLFSGGLIQQDATCRGCHARFRETFTIVTIRQERLPDPCPQPAV